MVDLNVLSQTVFSGFANGVLYAFIGLGFAFIYRSTGVINFAQGDLAILGAFITATLAAAGVSLLFAVPIAVIGCGLVSGAFFVLAVLPAKRAGISQLVIITVGFSIVIRGAITTIWGTAPVSVPPFSGGRPFDVAGISVLPQELWLMGMLGLTSVGIALFFSRTTIGLALRAGASNALGAAYVGIDKRRLGFVAFVSAGILAGLGGSVWAPISYAQADLGVAFAIKGFTAAVLGGLATAYGPIAGGLLLGIAEAMVTGYISSGYQEAITFGFLLVALILRPYGLLASGRQFNEVPQEPPIDNLQSLLFTSADYIRLIACLAVLIVLGFWLPSTFMTTAIFAGIDAIVVMGLVLLAGYAGQLSLGQGIFMMIGGYSSGYLTLVHNWPPIAALALGASLSCVVALIFGRVIFRLHGYYLAMSSLCALMIALNLARELSSITGGPNGLPGIPPFSLFGFRFVSEQANFFLVAGFCLVIVAIALSVTRSQFGRALLSLRSNEAAALACGVDATKIKARVFAVSAILASVAGSLYVHHLGLANPAPFGVDATIMQVTALVLGGVMSLWGSFFGATIVVLLPSLIVGVTGSSGDQQIAGLQYLVFGVILVSVVVLKSSDVRLRLRSLLRPRPMPTAVSLDSGSQ